MVGSIDLSSVLALLWKVPAAILPFFVGFQVVRAAFRRAL